MADLSRREFISAVPAVLLASTHIALNRMPPARIALVYAPEYERVRRAAEMSAREVQRAASLLHREFEFAAYSTAQGVTFDETLAALIVATPKRVDVPAVPIADVTGTWPCGPDVLQLAPQPAAPQLRVWHHSLERFGAAQLNDRFRAAAIPPDDHAWLGWFAVKLCWEATARARPPRELGYDGHKGMALRFNPAGRLLQPLYVVENDEVTREIRPTADQETATCGS